MTWNELCSPYSHSSGAHSAKAHDPLAMSVTFPVASRNTVAPAMMAIPTYEIDVRIMARIVPLGMAFEGSFRSPLMLAPARIPVAAGKKMANTEKKSCVTLLTGR